MLVVFNGWMCTGFGCVCFVWFLLYGDTVVLFACWSVFVVVFCVCGVVWLVGDSEL